MTYLAQIELKTDSGLPEDSSVNTLHFEIDPTAVSGGVVEIIENGGDLAGPEIGIHEALETLYDGLGIIFASTLTGVGEVKYYDLDDPTPRAPVLIKTLSWGAQGTSALPHEVALCVSFQAAKLSGVPQASRRNRIFLGPLAASISGTTTGRPAGGDLDFIRDLFDDLLDTSGTAAAWNWVTYSGKLGTSAPIDNGWIDNAFDTQRRRGVQPTSRSIWSV